MPQNFWENDPQVAPAQTRTGPQPVLTVPDTGKEQDRQRAEGADQRDQQRFEMQVEETGKRDTETRFNQEAKLRSEFDGNPEVKSYRSSLPMLNQALRAPKNGQGDISVIYAYAKLMDPTSVVRESEMDMVTNSSPWAQAKAQELQNQLDSSGRLPPQVRRNLEQEMIRTTAARRKAYDAQRNRYMENAKAYGLDPLLVVGKHDGEAFRADAQAYDKERGLGRFAEGFGQTTAAPPGAGPGAISPQMRGGLPVGTEITFDGDSDPDAQWWDRDAWLMQNHGVTPDQEIQIASFWNANRRNPGLTVEGARGWYQQNGLPVPSDETLAMEVARAREGSRQYGAFDDSAAREAYRQRLEQINNQNAQVRGFGTEGYDPNSPLSYLDRLTEAPLLGGADELAGVAGGFVNLLSGQDPVQGYRTARDAAALRNQQMEQNQGAVGTGLEIIGSLPTAALGPAGEFGTVRQAVKSGLKAGAPVGAVAGFNEGRGIEGSLGGAVTGGAVGGTVGGVTAGAGKWAVDKLAARAAGRAAQPLTEGGEVIAAADRLNSQFGTKIEPLPADVGGPGIRQASGNLSKMPIGSALMNRRADAMIDEVESARNAVSRILGTAQEPEVAGEGVIASLQKWLKTSKTKKDALYARAEKAGGDVPVDLANARAVADDLIAEAQNTPGGVAGLDDLIKLRADLDNPTTVIGARRMRTEQKGKIRGANLQYTPAEARILKVMDAADDDIVTSLSAAGKDDVAGMFAEANAANRARKQVIDEVVVPIIGGKADAPRSGEQVVQAIESFMKGNSARIGKLISILPEEDAGALKATLVNRLGRANNSNQNAAGDAFSTETFLTQWSGISDRSKSALFGGELRAALDDIAKLAGARRDATKAKFISPSGGQIGGAVSGMSLIGGMTVTPWAFLLNAIDGLGGWALSSPKVARWIAKYPSNPRLAERHIEGLKKIAVANPAIREDVSALYEALRSGLPSRATAPDESQRQGEGQTMAKPTTTGAQR